MIAADSHRIRLGHRRFDARVGQRPGPHRELQAAVEQSRINPAIDQVQHRLGNRRRRGFAAGHQIAGVLLPPAVDEARKQGLTVGKVPVERRARQAQPFGQRHDLDRLDPGLDQHRHRLHQARGRACPASRVRFGRFSWANPSLLRAPGTSRHEEGDKLDTCVDF